MASVDSFFDDAHRRVCIAKRGRPHEGDRAAIWTALAFPSAARGMIAKGWMVPAFGETPRVLGWYRFTESGWAEYDRRYAGAEDWFEANKARAL